MDPILLSVTSCLDVESPKFHAFCQEVVHSVSFSLVTALRIPTWQWSRRNGLSGIHSLTKVPNLARQYANNTTGVLNGVTQGIKRTNQDINAWRGDQAGANLILDDSEYLYRDILEGTKVVSRTNVFSAWDTTSMLAPGNNLNNALDDLMNDLIRKKNQVERINYTPIVRSQLLKLRDSADSLTKACFSKLPTGAALVARPVSNLITAKLDKGINAFVLPPSGSGSWWPSGGRAQPAPTVSGPSPYRNDPSPQRPPGNSGWGEGQRQQNNGGWGKK